MGSSNRGVTNVKLTLRVNHPATDKMKLSFAFMTGLASAQYAQPMYQQQPAMGGMGNNMLLPLLLLGDGLGGSGSSNDLLLPLMLMGGMCGAGGDMGGMNGLLPLLLLGGDEVKTPADLTALCATVTDVAKNAACTTAATAYATSHAACMATPTDACKAALKVEYATAATAAGASTGSNSDLLLLMAMGGMGGAGGAGMNSMLPLLLLGDGLGSGSGSSSDLLLPLMLMQQPQIDPATGQPMAGGLGGMDP